MRRTDESRRDGRLTAKEKTERPTGEGKTSRKRQEKWRAGSRGYRIREQKKERERELEGGFRLQTRKGKGRFFLLASSASSLEFCNPVRGFQFPGPFDLLGPLLFCLAV